MGEKDISTKKLDSMDKYVKSNVKKIREMKTAMKEQEMETVIEKLFALEKMMECSKQNCNRIHEDVSKSNNEILACRSTIKKMEKIAKEDSQAVREFSEKLERVEEKLNDSIRILQSIEHYGTRKKSSFGIFSLMLFVGFMLSTCPCNLMKI